MTRSTHDEAFDDWPVAGHDDAQFVGTVGAVGTVVPIYYDENEKTFFGAERDDVNERLERLSDYEWVLDDDTTIGEMIDELGEELGWESLSPFGESHSEE